MNGRDHYLANAVECQSMAAVTRDASERGTWLEMAESWLRLAEAIKNLAANRCSCAARLFGFRVSRFRVSNQAAHRRCCFGINR